MQEHTKGKPINVFLGVVVQIPLPSSFSVSAAGTFLVPPPAAPFAGDQRPQRRKTQNSPMHEGSHIARAIRRLFDICRIICMALAIWHWGHSYWHGFVEGTEGTGDFFSGNILKEFELVDLSGFHVHFLSNLCPLACGTQCV